MADGAEYNVEYTDENPEEFKWLKRAGPVKITYPNGDTFEGTVNADRLKHGQGKYTWNEKTEDDEVKEVASYDGAYENGKKHGVGKMVFPNGDAYHGQWTNDTIHGEGTLMYKNGDIFSGSFDQGIKHGKGTYEFAEDKSQLIGNWNQNAIVDGKWLFKDGGYYTGRFENATPIGQCLLQFPNGLQQEGEYVKVDTTNAAGDAVQVHTWKGDAVTKVF